MFISKFKPYNGAVRFVWIFNKQYSLQTFLSILSLMRHLNQENKNKVEVICLHDNSITQHTINIFLQYFPTITILEAPQLEYSTIPKYENDIKNRLLRTWVVENYSDKVCFLVDADTLFTNLINRIFPKLKDFKDSTCWGVVEYKNTYNAYLYFKKDNINPLSLTRRHKFMIFQQVFGKRWKKLLRPSQFNNGFVGFYNCYKLARRWREFYELGIENILVNPEDDQVPLSAAINDLQINKICLSNIFNSKGKLNGQYAMFHAWGGQWIGQLKIAIGLNTYKTNYGRVISNLLKHVHPRLVDEFKEIYDINGIKPKYYHLLDGKFDFENIYSEFASAQTEGNLLEIGSYSEAKGLSFLTELPQSDNRLVYSYLYKSTKTNIRKIYNNVDFLGIKNRILFISSLEEIKDNSLGFIFFETDKHKNNLINLLEQCLKKSMSGAIIAGYDFSGKRYKEKYNLYIQKFCDQHRLELSYRKKCFVINVQK